MLDHHPFHLCVGVVPHPGMRAGEVAGGGHQRQRRPASGAQASQLRRAAPGRGRDLDGGSRRGPGRLSSIVALSGIREDLLALLSEQSAVMTLGRQRAIFKCESAVGELA